ncbi:MAG: S26 family signal peptidase, partial [Alkalispirochaeta sp.]
ADRSRRRRARHTIRVLLLTIVVFGVWRLLGPGVAIVRDSSLAPILREGDIIWVRPARGDMELGAVVLVSPAFTEPSTSDDAASGTSRARPDALVPRIIAGMPGDEITWTDTVVSAVRPTQEPFRLSPGELHPLARQAERSVVVEDETVFIVSLSGGMIDSRLMGPRPEDVLHYQVRRIIWPRDRRGVIPPVASDSRFSP